MTIHNFSESHERSKSDEMLPIWETAYRVVFPDFLGMVSSGRANQNQADGIDRVIVTGSGHFTIEEKLRRTNFDDIALEYQHVFESGQIRPGWIECGMRADYIAYLILPIKKIYVFPRYQLQQAWRENRADWLNQGKIAIAENNGYKSYSCCLQAKTIWKGIYAFFNSCLVEFV